MDLADEDAQKAASLLQQAKQQYEKATEDLRTTRKRRQVAQVDLHGPFESS